MGRDWEAIVVGWSVLDFHQPSRPLLLVLQCLSLAVAPHLRPHYCLRPSPAQLAASSPFHHREEFRAHGQTACVLLQRLDQDEDDPLD